MHDKYFIIPILDEIKTCIKESPTHQVLLHVGEFVNLTPEKIMNSLHLLMSETFQEYPDLKIQFTTLEGKILCLDCNYEGKPGTIYADPHAHTDIVVECPSCHSTQTKKLEGARIKVTPIT